MITTETIIYPEEYWMNSQLATARHYGGAIINGKEYVIVNKEGKDLWELSSDAYKTKAIPEGEPADLILKEWQPIYRALGRDAFIEHLKINQDLEKAKKYVKQLKSKEK
jgi:hypothetical protein